jgi:hypothetical protein
MPDSKNFQYSLIMNKLKGAAMLYIIFTFDNCFAQNSVSIHPCPCPSGNDAQLMLYEKKLP